MEASSAHAVPVSLPETAALPEGTGQDQSHANAISDPCYLLELPAELRNTIIELYLTSLHEGLVYLHKTSNFFNRGPSDPPSLAFTNRQLRSETLPMFFALNVFDLGELNTQRQWDITRRWLIANNVYLKHIVEVTFHLCCLHDYQLAIRGKVGKPASSGTVHEELYCPLMRRRWANGEQWKQICKRIGSDGFEAKDYIIAAQIYLTDTSIVPCAELEADDYPTASGSDNDSLDADTDEADEDDSCSGLGYDVPEGDDTLIDPV